MIQPNMPVLDTCGTQDWKRQGSDVSPADIYSSESQKYTTSIVFNGNGNECMGKCSDLHYNDFYNIRCIKNIVKLIQINDKIIIN